MLKLTGASLPLSAREELVALLFADGHTAEETSLTMGLAPETVRAYLVNVRLKYKNAGRDAEYPCSRRGTGREDYSRP